MKLTLFISRRYFLSKKSHSTVFTISILTMIAIAIITMAMVVIMSIFDGLETLQKDRLKNFYSPIRLLPDKGKYWTLDKNKIEQIKSLSNVNYLIPIVENKVLLTYKKNYKVIKLRGVDSSFFRAKSFDSLIYYGDSFNNKKGINNGLLIGESIAVEFSLPLRDYKDKLTCHVPKSTLNSNLQSFTNSQETLRSIEGFGVGVFYVNQDINQQYVISRLAWARSLFDLDSSQVSFYDIELNDETQEQNTIEEIANILDDTPYRVETIEQINELLTKVIKTEKLFTFLLCLLILAIASFNIIGGVTMLIIDKKSNIHTLNNMGMTISEIKKIFVYLSIKISFWGAVIGCSLGAILVFFQNKFSFIKIGSLDIAYPMDLSFIFIVYTMLGVIILAILASQITVLGFNNKIKNS